MWQSSTLGDGSPRHRGWIVYPKHYRDDDFQLRNKLQATRSATKLDESGSDLMEIL